MSGPRRRVATALFRTLEPTRYYLIYCRQLRNKQGVQVARMKFGPPLGHFRVFCSFRGRPAHRARTSAPVPASGPAPRRTCRPCPVPRPRLSVGSLPVPISRRVPVCRAVRPVAVRFIERERAAVPRRRSLAAYALRLLPVGYSVNLSPVG